MRFLCQQIPKIVSITWTLLEPGHNQVTQLRSLLIVESKHRGFAFITFSSPMDAQDAIDNYDFNELPGRQGQGRYLKVNLARPDNKAAGAAGMRGDRAGTCNDSTTHSASLECTLTTRPIATTQSGLRKNGLWSTPNHWTNLRGQRCKLLYPLV